MHLIMTRAQKSKKHSRKEQFSDMLRSQTDTILLDMGATSVGWAPSTVLKMEMFSNQTSRMDMRDSSMGWVPATILKMDTTSCHSCRVDRKVNTVTSQIKGYMKFSTRIHEKTENLSKR